MLAALLRQPWVDMQGVRVSYQETYQHTMVSGMQCFGLKCANGNKKGYFCHLFFFFFFKSNMIQQKNSGL